MESEEVDVVEVRSWRMLLTCRISWIAAAGDEEEQRGEDVENVLKCLKSCFRLFSVKYYSLINFNYYLSE